MHKSRLGKGLSSLIPVEPFPDSDQVDKFIIISIYKIIVNLEQPRKIFDETSLLELSESIKNYGVLQPIIVAPDENDCFKLIAGERRFRASKMAGINTIPAFVKQISDKKTQLEVSIIENIQRKDLNVIEEANAYQKLINQFNYTHQDLSNILQKSRSHITNLLRLLVLPNEIQSAIIDGKISMGHARALVNSENPQLYLTQILNNKLSVRKTESLIREKGKHENKEKQEKKLEKKDNLLKLEVLLSQKLGGMKVIIDEGTKQDSGTITIEFKNIEELNLLLKKFL
ncbi:MAG: chromosome partitioning protein ParB [Candidatus Xenolissoclinum pacificiensis L6]|uniref:Probable chromosome-partitioning protein ParB n=1 Tax=Candidatus Xenolissoclinum pacificiensis L6 TaxID=1401685 RepID=W2V122_9RICK|nr:MAG: chromosome partitioning protein ParB [Candidatus Xenolissoclinum pacificiensis L6]